MFANVIVEYGVKSLNQKFIYKIPNNLLGKIKVGMKVYVPFGSQEIFGFVLEITDKNNTDYALKEIIRVDNENLVLNEELMAIGKYVADSTLCTLITAYQTMLPSGLKIKNKFINMICMTNILKLKIPIKI